MCSPSGFVFILVASIFINFINNGAVVVVAARKNIDHNGAGVAEGVVDVGRRRIDITRKQSIQVNGVEVDEKSLVDYLESHERELIFGKSDKNRAVKLVHLRHLTDADDGADDEEEVISVASTNGKAGAAVKTIVPHENKGKATEQKIKHVPSRRVKRADTAADAGGTAAITATATTTAETVATEPLQESGAQKRQELSVQIRDNEHLVNLKLHQTPKLIDDAFVFIRRYANSTQLIEDSHKLAEQYAHCFYRNENSALDLCDDENVRGIFHHNSTDFIIHPLPPRFGNSTHVILESSKKYLYDHENSSISPAANLLDSNLQFEPDEVEFNQAGTLPESVTLSEMEETSPTTFNIAHNSNETSTIDIQGYSSSKNEANSSEQHHQYNLHQHHSEIPLNLRYKPRYHHFQRKQHNNHHHNHHEHGHHRQHVKQGTHHSDQQHRRRRHISSGGQQKVPQVLHIETAIFVDSDLFKHMAKNFPFDTERNLMRFVLAMINGVQLLYHHPSLGHSVSFVLKRLEILYKDPKDLRRSSDIDIYLSNFCLWQKKNNPSSDSDAFHYDHAVILTGLDLYVINKNGKVISQVVGLAPVAGMCTTTSSCTINEGKHFESVFVVAHEIGHNLGMRHDTNEDSCDPHAFIMSPTLGSGKITWSKCSRDYLNTFLEKPQAECLFDRGQFMNNLDHSAEGILPGQRFNASQQCMLKYGRDSVRARTQNLADICRDLHCQRERYTWTSHPALEGTECGHNMWCRSGLCVMRPSVVETFSSPNKHSLSIGKSGYDKASFLESNKMGLLHEYNYSKHPSWGEWSTASECDSGCLYGPSKRLREGSTGLKTYTRSCLDHRRRCLGRDRKFESCVAKNCYSIPITTIETFAMQVCERVKRFDSDLTGEGQQISGDIEESCKVICKTKTNGTKSRNWTFPDGTSCRSKLYYPDDISYCIAGRCEKFSCDNSTNNYYKIGATFCQNRQPPPQVQSQPTGMEAENRRIQNFNTIGTYYNNNNNNYKENNNNINTYSNHITNYNRYGEVGRRGAGNSFYNRRSSGGTYGPTTMRNKYENEVAVRSYRDQQYEHYKRKADQYASWNKYNYHLNEQTPRVAPPVAASLVAAPPPLPPQPPVPISSALETEWVIKSGCHASCIDRSKGIQVVESRRTRVNNIQLCAPTLKPCERLQTATEFAEQTCARYKLKVRGLSGHGTQIAASIEEPDRSCRVGCQDEFIKYRFYLVNGRYGHFPLGTKCSYTDERYCVNGKCLEFGKDNIPKQQSHISLALFRNRRALDDATGTARHNRHKRSYLYYEPVNITETLTQDFINSIVNSIMNFEKKVLGDEFVTAEHIEFTNPIHVSMDELSTK